LSESARGGSEHHHRNDAAPDPDASTAIGDPVPQPVAGVEVSEGELQVQDPSLGVAKA